MLLLTLSRFLVVIVWNPFCYSICAVVTIIDAGSRVCCHELRPVRSNPIRYNPRFETDKPATCSINSQGDPVWAISSDTINSLLGLSLNFFFVLPLTNAVGIHVIEAPVLHPMSEGLFNFVIGWTLMFAPLLFTDFKNDRYKGSLDILWGFQMFLTNTFLIPYMAIRLNKADKEDPPRKLSQLGTLMIQGAHIVGLIGGVVTLISILWGLFGRPDSEFGNISQRWDYLWSYLGTERLAYAFIWDIVLYAFFQPWLIGDNLANVKENNVTFVNYLRFVPVIGLVAYLLCLKRDEKMYMVDTLESK